MTGEHAPSEPKWRCPKCGRYLFTGPIGPGSRITIKHGCNATSVLTEQGIIEVRMG